jgi:hypothetical protein
MPRKTKQYQRRKQRTKRRTKKAIAPRNKHMLVGGSAGCEQAATIMEPGFSITSHLKNSAGLTIPSSRALLSGAMPSCNKGSHP